MNLTIFKPKRGFFLIFYLFLLRGDISAQIAAPYDILINEFMPDPAPQVFLPNSEFIELFNRSNKTYNLEGFKIYNGSVSTTLPSRLLKPNAYVIIYTKKTGIDFGKYGDTIQVTKLVTLSNPNDTFYLASPNGTVIDVASYDLSFYQSSKKAEGGWSLERTRPNAPCNPNIWTASVDLVGGTPGKRNSVAVDSVDKQSLELDRYYLKDDKNIVLLFTKSLDRALAVATPQYQMSDNIKISSIDIISPSFQIVQLKLGTVLQPKKQYQLLLKNSLKDCQGIPLSKTDTLLIQLPERILRNDLVVNEILTNPEVGGSRFIEFYNRSAKVVDMANLKIANLPNDVKAVTTNILLFPNQYAVLTENPSDIQNRYNATDFRKKIIKNKLPTWDEKIGTVALYFVDTTGKSIIIDSFTYQKSWHNPLIANTEGVSLERVDPSKPSNGSSNWQSAAQTVGFATPAQRNSQFDTTDVAISTEVFTLEKKTFSPDGDGFEDFLSLNYHFDSDGYAATIRIFNDKGKLVKTLINNELMDTEGVVKWEGDTDEVLKIRAGIHILAIEWISPKGKVQREKLACIVAGRL